MEWREIFANKAIEKLISKIYKHPHLAPCQKDTMKKWEEDLYRYFSKEGIQMAKAHEKILNLTDHWEGGREAKVVSDSL